MVIVRRKNDITVQETNDHSILSKASVAHYGYFNDPFLKYFIKRVHRRTPLLNRGYYIRTKVVDYAISSFLRQNFPRCQIVSLGAGFDSSYFRFKSKQALSGCKYYEIDFENVVKRKQALIKKFNPLISLIDNAKFSEDLLVSDDYYLVSCDLTKTKLLEKRLWDIGVDFSLPTLLFSECVLTYVEYKDSITLLGWIREMFLNCQLSIYEQINPHDAFGVVMMKHFNKMQSPLKRIDTLHTLQLHKKSLLDLNFPHVVAMDMNFFYENYVGEDERKSISGLELFDEFEEWHLKCTHYAFVNAFQGSLVDFSKTCYHVEQPILTPSVIRKVNLHKIPVNDGVGDLTQRFGHACCELSDGRTLVTGGFGPADNTHKRLNTGFIYDAHIHDATLLRLDTPRMFHTITPLSNGCVFVYGGRAAPNKPCCDYGMYNVVGDCLQRVVDQQCCDAAPKLRWRHAAVNIKDNVFISGGISKCNELCNDVWYFDTLQFVWKQLAVIIDERHSHIMLQWKDDLLFYGGLNQDMKALCDLSIVNINSPTFKENLSITPPLPKRYSHTGHVINNSLVVIGGVEPANHRPPSIICVDLLSKTWTPLQLSNFDAESPLMLHNHASAILQNTIITCDDNLQNENSSATLQNKNDNLQNGNAVNNLQNEDINDNLKNRVVIIFGGGGTCMSFGTHFNKDIAVIQIPKNKK